VRKKKERKMVSVPLEEVRERHLALEVRESIF
jgi:hypothetical protein